MTAIIITGCIAPEKQKYLQISDEQERLHQYVESISFYIEEVGKEVDAVIFCENSNYEYNTDSLKELAKKNNVNFEWISFAGDKSLISRRGKGAGEGEVISYALNKTKNKIDYIIKITGRLRVVNISEIILKLDKTKIYFNPDLYIFSEKALDTRFFACPRKYYDEVIAKAYNRCDDKENNIERLLYNTESKKNFPLYPIIQGKSGGFGYEYGDESKSRKIILDILCRFNLIHYNIALKSCRKILCFFGKW